jgi:PAS domain S-box-containing protein
MARSSESLDVSVRSAAGGEYSDRLAREQLIALNRKGRSTNFVPPATSIILVGMLWGGVSPVLLLVWLGLVWATSVLRFFMYQRFETQVVLGGGDDRGWRRIWVGVYGLSGAVWGIGSVLMFPQDSVLIQTFLVVFVLGMASGGTAGFAPYLPALIAYVVPLTFPIATVLLLQESTAHVILGFGGYIFVLALGFLGRAGSRNFAASFRLGIENEDLAQELTAAQIRLAGALDSMSEAFALFDADECLVECNNKFDELLPEIQPALFSGLAFEKFFELLGHSDQIRGSVGRTNEWSDEIVRRCRTGELPIEIELSDGRWLMLNQAATDDGGIVTTFADISQLKQHEAEISDSEQRFRDFASAASDWVWETDVEGRFVHLSGRYAEVTGRSPDAMLGRNMFDNPSVEYPGDWERLLAATDERQPFRNVRIVRPREDGEVFHFVANGLPIYGASGVFLGYRGTGSDVTATVRAENRARVAQSQLFEAIESIPAGFILFDKHGQLSLWNSHAPRYLPGATSLIVSGVNFEALMRACVENDAILDAVEQPDDWLTAQNKWFVDPVDQREIRFSDGRHVQFLGRRTADGGTVCVVTDISDIRRGQEELAEKLTFLQATLEGMGEGLVVLDAGLRTVLSNARLGRLAIWGEGKSTDGLLLEEILDSIGATVIGMHDLSNSEMAPLALYDRLGDRVPFQFEVTRIGRQVMMVRADPLPDSGWVCVFTDVTAERRALAALEESEDRYRRVTEASPDMIAVQSGGRFVFVNAAGAHLLGVGSAENMVGRRVLDFVHADDHEIARITAPSKSFDSTAAFQEFQALRSDGQLFHAEALGTEFAYRGKPSVLMIWRDITDRKIAQAQLIQTSKLALLGEMAASMAHELNQPLNIIRMAADASLILMEEDKADLESHREEFTRISNQTERMADIVNHLRIFSRQDDLSEARFDPVASLAAAATMVREQYLLDGVEVRTVLPKQTASVRGQPNRLEQVVLNLLANARDAVMGHSRATDGKPAGIIELSAFLADSNHESAENLRPDEVVITISDNGGGIPEETIGRVFEPFFTTKDVGEGTGLGLAIGYSIVSGMGGVISVSNNAHGAVFEIRLPEADETDTPPANQIAGE